jgi:hypothetical protein
MCHSKQKPKLKTRLSTLTDLIKWARWTATPKTTYTTSSCDYPIFIKEKLSENRRLHGTYTGHLQTKNYTTGLHKSLNSSFMNTKNTTSKRSSTVLPPRIPLITLCGKIQKDLKQSLKLLHHFGLHKEHGQKRLLIKRRPSPFTLSLYSNLTHLNPTPFLKTL